MKWLTVVVWRPSDGLHGGNVLCVGVHRLEGALIGGERDLLGQNQKNINSVTRTRFQTKSLLSLPPEARYWLSGDHLSPHTSWR